MTKRVLLMPLCMGWVPFARCSQMLIWSRHLGPTTPTEPGMERSVAVLFNTGTGKYVPKPMPQSPFCSGAGQRRRACGLRAVLAAGYRLAAA